VTQTIPFSPSLLDTHLLVDARTPLEYAEDHIPMAINVPLLTDEERVEIGTLYKVSGPHQARRRGLELTASRFPVMVDTIAAAAQGRPIIVYCWRGGLRSKTITAILDLTGFPACQLEGGYKAFRNDITRYFEPFLPPGPLVVLHGMTGIGKTILLHQLQGNGLATIDLEGIACHRGSAFGSLGLSQELSQKCFETRLWDAFRRLPPGQPIIIEGESRRIGKVFLPGNLYDVMQDSRKIWCTASLGMRVKRLIDEYGIPEYQSGMAIALDKIKKKLGGTKYAEIAGYLERWELEPFMTHLILDYYDKLYYKTKEWQENATISLEDYDQAEQELRSYLQLAS
jgi:tRNA 2-selenouridine synthase